MLKREDLDATTEDLRDMIAQRLNVHARSFPSAVRKAGRLLPPQARVAAAQLEALKTRLDHPKLAARTDPGLAEDAAETIRQSLQQHRPGDRAARDRAFLMAEIGFRALVLLGIGLAFLHWQGLG